MNTTQIATKLNAYTVTDWTDSYGQTTVAAKNGSRCAYIKAEADGRLHVSCFIEYGEGYGRSWCDSGTYKTESGAIRKAAGFLK